MVEGYTVVPHYGQVDMKWGEAGPDTLGLTFLLSGCSAIMHGVSRETHRVQFSADGFGSVVNKEIDEATTFHVVSK